MTQVDTLLDWAAQGQQRLEQAVGELRDADVPAPSALPGWTRGHVITHLARNADALVNLLTWARTGTPTPMYDSREQRDRDIAAGAPRPLAEQAADLQESGRRFAVAAAAMPATGWSARVTSAQGRDIPAATVPWLRVREVWIHLVDLNVGYGIQVLPDDVAAALVTDVAAWMTPKLDEPVELAPDGHDAVLMGESEPATVVRGPAYRIAGWLTGRGDLTGLATEGTVPELPRWL